MHVILLHPSALLVLILSYLWSYHVGEAFYCWFSHTHFTPLFLFVNGGGDLEKAQGVEKVHVAESEFWNKCSVLVIVSTCFSDIFSLLLMQQFTGT